MTKYVLNSGGIGNNPKLAKEFFAEVTKGMGSNPKILLCFFAKPREDWEIGFAEDIENSKTFMPDIEPQFEMAMPGKFEEQLNQNDAVYIHGGDDHLLQYWLNQFDIPKIWDGKVVATNSASSHALSKHFWTCDWRKLMDGLGTLSIKFLAHYKSEYGIDDPRGPIDWEAALEELEEYGDASLPIYALKEGEYVVIEK